MLHLSHNELPKIDTFGGTVYKKIIKEKKMSGNVSISLRPKKKKTSVRTDFEPLQML